ncbi:serine hydrolase [Aliiglaciecola sp. CAU 1673]|uniref:serine hydrolase domain-containing protein n=1 Tax=Aliiglaciecola sp. CAU 1673 TaxID=3032595 RepID=UPI0023D9BD49|nr:serine hydrolase domain-containing protein [Aliiglaciecola sp. CAU 1673]MDF2179663.1 serine hydrolase [Aliiglaciecola sp. CAU 1673]
MRAFVLTLLLLAPLMVKAQENWLGAYAEDVKKAAKQQQLPGYAFAYVNVGKKDQIFQYGKTKKDGHAINPDTLFRLASVSKTFTGVLTAKLAEQGQLNLKQPLSKLVPGYPFDPKLANSMTLEHILSQSSGYMPNAFDNLIEANYSVDRVMQQLAGLKPICSPGQCYTYQNALFGAVEQGMYSGLKRNYAQLLSEQFLKPLSIKRINVGRDALIKDNNWAEPHVLIGPKQWKKVAVSEDYYRFAPAAGVNASVRDMTTWLKLLLGQYPHVLSGHSIEQVLQPRTKTRKELYRRHWRGHLKDAHYGLGWRIYDFEGERLAYHSGWVKGYRADIGFAPKYNAGYVFLMNAESNLMNEISVDFWTRFFEQQRLQAKKNGKKQNTGK